MSSRGISVLEEIPLFTLILAQPQSSKFDNVFYGWPAEKLGMIQKAQETRDRLVEHMKGVCSFTQRVSDIDAYIPYMLAVEKEKQENPRIAASKDHKFHWKQTPLIVDKYIDRYFNADYCQNEVLHAIWLKAILLLNEADTLHKADKDDEAISYLRNCAGIFQYLAADRLRMTSNAVPIEFQPPVFNSLVTLSLGQVYALIALKGERDGLSKKALGKLCYTIANTFSSSLESIRSATPKEAFHVQYINWVEGMSYYFLACSSILFAQSQWTSEEAGSAIGLIRYAMKNLEKAISIDKRNERINKACQNLLNTIKPKNEQWSQENFTVYTQAVHDEVEVKRFLSSSSLTQLNLPQPSSYVIPEPSTDFPTTQGSEESKVKKIGPPSDPK